MIPPIASRFVAGETSAEALAHVDDLNARGVGAILNLLGEHYDDRAPADADAQAYRDLVDDVADADANACISVKPSQIGLDVSDEVFHENADAIAGHAADRGVFTWIDMEGHTTTDATLDAYERLATEHGGGVGVCVQANLRRTRDDLERLADLPGKVRLVKGAYDPPSDVAYRDKGRVNHEYENLLAYVFREFDGGIAVGSHDSRMIDRARDLHDEHGTEFEVQMLMGVREDAQFDLADEYEVWQYAPYGDKWLSYFYRRVMERKENALFALRAILGR
jgi:proline dehydrogenase